MGKILECDYTVLNSSIKYGNYHTSKAGLTVFDYIKVMTNGGPAQSTEAVGLLIYRHAINEGKFSTSVAESMILFVIVGVVSAFSLRLTSNKQVGE